MKTDKPWFFIAKIHEAAAVTVDLAVLQELHLGPPFVRTKIIITLMLLKIFQALT